VVISSNAIDVLVVGGGNAGFTAAAQAAEAGARRVVPIHKCPEEWATLSLRQALSELYTRAQQTCCVSLTTRHGFAWSYSSASSLTPPQNFANRSTRMISGRTDPGLSQSLIEESNAAIKWLLLCFPRQRHLRLCEQVLRPPGSA
jgi:choline dehydrogenase-like flavoprotein